MTLHLEELSMRHVRMVAADIRWQDAREIYSATGKNPGQVLAYGWASSDFGHAICEVDGTAICVFGVVRHGLPSVGVPWMYATDRITRYPMTIARHTHEPVDEMHRHFPVLMNCVDKRNALHIRWLQWAGFKFLRETTTFAKDGSPFLEFVKIKHV